MKTWVLVKATSQKTRVVVTMGEAVVMRARLPPLVAVRNQRAVTTLLEALSLWMDERLCVALHADDADGCSRFDLTDEIGLGARSVYYAVELVRLEPHRRTRSPEAGRAEQLALVVQAGGRR
jgi:hypothetical protein